VEGAIDLGTFAELGVALAGFTALIAVLRGGSIGSWHPRARVALWYIVCHGLGAVLFALLPSLLAVLQPVSWTGALIALALFHVAAFGLLFRRHLTLLSEGISTPNTWYYWLNGVVSVINVAVLGLGALGWLSAPASAIYEFGVASCVLLAGFALVGVLRLPEPAA
jgi:hypothetical protein